MEIFGRALVASFVGNTIAVLLILHLHRLRLPFVDGAVILAIIVIASASTPMRVMRTRIMSPRERRGFVTKFALLLPVITLAVHAIAWTAVHYQDSRLILPRRLEHWLAIFSAVAALLGWFVYFHHLERKHKKA